MKLLFIAIASSFSVFITHCGDETTETDNSNAKKNKENSPVIHNTSAPAPDADSSTITDRIPLHDNAGTSNNGGPNTPSPTPNPTPLSEAVITGTCSGKTTSDNGISWDECILLTGVSDSTVRNKCANAGGVFADSATCSQANLIGTCSNNQDINGFSRNVYKTGNDAIDAILYKQLKANCTTPNTWSEPLVP